MPTECEHIATRTVLAVITTDAGEVRALVTTCVTCHKTTVIEEDRW